MEYKKRRAISSKGSETGEDRSVNNDWCRYLTSISIIDRPDEIFVDSDIFLLGNLVPGEYTSHK